MDTYRVEILPINEPDKNVPTSILVKVFKVVSNDKTGKETEELERTIEYFPKKYRKKPKYDKK
jgi:hypothetical protein